MTQLTDALHVLIPVFISESFQKVVISIGESAHVLHGVGVHYLRAWPLGHAQDVLCTV